MPYDKDRTMYCWSEPKANLMRWIFLAAVIVFSSSSAFALQTKVEKATQIGTGCVGPIVSAALKLRTCAISGAKTRIWCPNGQIFDDDGAKTSVPLARSLCNLTQVPD